MDQQTLDVVASNLTIAYFAQVAKQPANDYEKVSHDATQRQQSVELPHLEEEVIKKFLDIRHRLRKEIGRHAGKVD